MDHRRNVGRNFGRRAPPQRSITVSLAEDAPVKLIEKQPVPISVGQVTHAPSVEDEIKAWKSARGPSLAIFPWRQLSLMAGLCFGIASFVLPASINDAVQWPLYGLAAVSFYMGLHKRKTGTT